MRGTMQPVPTSRSTAGFTLIELMVVIVIGSILLAVAIPSYQSQIRKSRRTDAKTAVLDLAGREERFFSTNGSAYTNAPGNLGYVGFGVANPVGSGYYYLTVCSPACAPSVAAAPSYSVKATPVPGSTQVNDLECTSFSVDSTGKQFVTGGGTVASCWGN